MQKSTENNNNNKINCVTKSHKHWQSCVANRLPTIWVASPLWTNNWISSGQRTQASWNTCITCTWMQAQYFGKLPSKEVLTFTRTWLRPTHWQSMAHLPKHQNVQMTKRTWAPHVPRVTSLDQDTGRLMLPTSTLHCDPLHPLDTFDQGRLRDSLIN